jgi:hypothetical protein
MEQIQMDGQLEFMGLMMILHLMDKFIMMIKRNFMITGVLIVKLDVYTIILKEH